MKKMIAAVLLALLALLAPALGLAQTQYVYDNADLLTVSQESELQAEIEAIKAQYDYEIVLVTESSIGNKTITEYADDFYDYNGFGVNGMLFLLDIGSRQYWTSTSGHGIYAFTDYGIERLGDAIKPDLSAGNYYAAFGRYLNMAQDYLKQAAQGHPYDSAGSYAGGRSVNYGAWAIGIPIAALVIALITVSIMKYGMKTARKRTEAGEYVRPGSFRLTRQQDIYLYSHVTKVKIETSSSGGGSSTHTSSSGRSHGGGGGRF